MRCFVCLAVLGILGLAASSKAVIIDSFDDGGSLLTRSTVGTSGSVGSATVLGGFRRAELEVLASSGEVASFDIGDGVATVSTGLDQFHEARLAYGYDTSGPVSLGLDLTGQVIRLNFTFSDLPLHIEVELISGDDPANSALYQLNLIGGLFNNFTEELPVGDFTTSGAFDVTDVSQMWFRFSSNAPRGANDYELASIEMVPEPATIAALAAGVGLMARRRRK